MLWGFIFCCVECTLVTVGHELDIDVYTECSDNCDMYQLIIGVARFIDASIYRDTFPAIRIAILVFTIAIFFFVNILFFVYLFSTMIFI